MSKKNEIAVIKDTDLAKVDNNLLNVEQLNFLLQKTPKSQLSTRKGKGGQTWTYVTGTYIKKVLNLMFGWDWDFEIIKHEFDLNVKQAYVLGRLTVRTNGKSIIKMQFGRQDIKFKTEPVIDENGQPVMYNCRHTNTMKQKRQPTNEPLDLGNDLKGAATDSLKKCASELGIASDVYAPDEFKAIQVVDAKDLEPLPADIITKIQTFTDSIDLMEYANSKEAADWQKNAQFISLIDVQRLKIEA